MIDMPSGGWWGEETEEDIAMEKERERIKKEKAKYKKTFDEIKNKVHSLQSDNIYKSDLKRQDTILGHLVTDEFIDSFFEKIDADKDGEITFNEFYSFCKAVERGEAEGL